MQVSLEWVQVNITCSNGIKWAERNNLEPFSKIKSIETGLKVIETVDVSQVLSILNSAKKIVKESSKQSSKY